MSGYELGSFSMIVSAFIIFILISLISKFTGNKEKEFDERQEMIRSKGYKYAFYVLMYYVIFKILWDIWQETEGGPNIMDFAAICLVIIVYASYAILHDGYLSMNQRPVWTMISLFILSAVNLTIGIDEIRHPYDENLFSGQTSLLVGATGAVLMILILAKFIYNKKRDANETEEE